MFCFSSLVLPTLDYCLSLWDPHFAIYSKKLESVQTFTTRIISKNWRGSSSDLASRLQLPSLSIRRRKQKVSLCYRIINNLSVIPHSFFTPHPSPHLRHNHSLPLYYPPIHSVSHLSSLSVSVIPLWNCPPPDLDMSSPSLFKQRLNNFHFCDCNFVLFLLLLLTMSQCCISCYNVPYLLLFTCVLFPLLTSCIPRYISLIVVL